VWGAAAGVRAPVVAVVRAAVAAGATRVSLQLARDVEAGAQP